MKKFSYLITESKTLKDLPIKKVAILFTDVKDSSTLWSKSEDKMFESLSDLEDMMNSIIVENNGMVVKTIGDSFMCSYESDEALFDSIKSAVIIQKHLNETPIKAGTNELRIRIGICYGDVYIRESKIQDVNLKDYFGNTVGSASRLESKVSEVGGFAFSFLENIDKKLEEDILKYLEDNDIKIEVIEYDNKCDKESTRKRSARLLTDLQVNSCEDIIQLKGVNPLRVYKCELKYK